jgi:hypothetical protein
MRTVGDRRQQDADENGFDGIGSRRAGQLVGAQSDGCDRQADERGGVLREYGPKRRVARGHDRADEVPFHQLRGGPRLADRPQEQDSLERERDREYDVADKKVARRRARSRPTLDEAATVVDACSKLVGGNY